ncbi:DUF969 domain-containing protein [Burkholderia singularis]|uniref:FIG015373: Membrane protein n=1 Tax=Burkholderia singularis TaxID=1503053 RepID=A0A238H819_9BURK|nr:DUF969 domain-containing protein [Burkholderia singularis]SMG01469.1 FIG015373: Membrane protein [Burkholderia singularis]
MSNTVSLWPLVGVAVIVAGFALRFNPMLIVALAAIATAASAHFPPARILAAIGAGFLKTRNIPLIILLPLAVIGLLERHGLRERAQTWIAGIRAATAGRLLIIYLIVRELSAAVGLTGLGGHPQMVRPLIAPMAEGAAENRFGPLPDATRHRLRAYAAATDNVGLFFGEDIFVAFGAIVLMVTFLKEAGVSVEPMHVALWGIPTALAALAIHGFRLWRLDRQLERELGGLAAARHADGPPAADGAQHAGQAGRGAPEADAKATPRRADRA